MDCHFSQLCQVNRKAALPRAESWRGTAGAESPFQRGTCPGRKAKLEGQTDEERKEGSFSTLFTLKGNMKKKENKRNSFSRRQECLGQLRNADVRCTDAPRFRFLLTGYLTTVRLRVRKHPAKGDPQKAGDHARAKPASSNKCHASSNRCLTSSNKCHASSNKCLTSSNKVCY